jgi:hypothetical protein
MCPNCDKFFDIDDERVEGMDEIRKIIDPRMSRTVFYRKIRPRINHLLMERSQRNPRLRGNKPIYFTFRRFLYAWMIETKII